MKEKLIKTSKVIILLLILFVPFYITPISRADSGWDSSYDSGGDSYDSGGGWDSDYESDGGGSGINSEAATAMIFFLILLMIFAMYAESKSTQKVEDKNKYITYMYNDITEEQLKKIMPNDNVEHLKLEAFHNFIEIQDAWMNFDYKKLREYCSDELYNSYKAQLDILKLKNSQNIMYEYEAIDTKIIDIYSSNGEIVMKVFMCVEFFDYVINTKTYEVTRGSNEYKILNNYEMTFVMKDPKKSKQETKCPNCGAKIKHNTSGECEYCNATIVKKAAKFVLTTKKNVNK